MARGRCWWKCRASWMPRGWARPAAWRRASMWAGWPWCWPCSIATGASRCRSTMCSRTWWVASISTSPPGTCPWRWRWRPACGRSRCRPTSWCSANWGSPARCARSPSARSASARPRSWAIAARWCPRPMCRARRWKASRCAAWRASRMRCARCSADPTYNRAMFAKLTERLGKAVESLRGRGRLTEDNIAESLREVRMALLEVDVALPVVKRFIDAVKAKAVGTEVVGSLTPGQALIGVIHDELVTLMAGSAQAFDLRHAPPAVILLAGLQGAGKTTTAGKLARHLIQQKKRVLLVSTDIRRPAAVLQLQRLAEQVGADFHPVAPGAAPAKIASTALDAARRGVYDVLIVDTAGRLHIDAELMQEVRDIDAAVAPHERIFVVDAMAGQDAVNAARAFGEALQLTGTILTKADGDARGGAALSVREITGSPLLSIGTGEKSEWLENVDLS